MSEEKVRENYLHKIRGAEINRTSSNDLSPLHIVMRKSDKEEIEAGTPIRSAAAASSRAANLDYIKTSILSTPRYNFASGQLQSTPSLLQMNGSSSPKQPGLTSHQLPTLPLRQQQN